MGLYILCPYFKRERKRSITCEDTIRLYSTSGEKRKILNIYCCSEWKRCPFASALESIYAEDISEEELKEKIMENTLESMKKEINNLMRENGQLMKKLEVLKAQIDDRDKVAEKNHEMYMRTIKNKESLLKAKDEQIKWLESFASAYLIVAFGEDKEIHISKDELLELMTKYTLSIKLDEESGDWVFMAGYAKGNENG